MKAIDLFAGAGGFTLGAAMGFPAQYRLPEDHDGAMHMLGNAVPPPMARDVLTALRRAA